MHELIDILAPYIATGFRVTGLLVSAPVLGSASVPVRVKTGLLFALVVFVTPLASREVNASQLPSVVFPEFLIGLLIGFSAQLVFEAVLMAGNLTGVQIGVSLVSILDPQTNADTPVISIAHQMLATMIFLKLNGHLLLVRCVARSFEIVPQTGLNLASVVPDLCHNFGAIWTLGLQLAAPILCVTVCMDIVAAFIGKASPQLPVTMLAASAKTLVGLGVLGMTIAFWPNTLGDALLAAVARTDRLFR